MKKMHNFFMSIFMAFIAFFLTIKMYKLKIHFFTHFAGSQVTSEGAILVVTAVKSRVCIYSVYSIDKHSTLSVYIRYSMRINSTPASRPTVTGSLL